MQYNNVKSKKFVIPVKTGPQYLKFLLDLRWSYPVLDTGRE